MTHYPELPGYKDQTTSKDAAFALLKGPRPTRHKILRTAVLELYQAGFEGTADDCGERLGISPFSCRPRVTELYKQGLLERVRKVAQSGSQRFIMRLAKETKIQRLEKILGPDQVLPEIKAVADQLNLLLEPSMQTCSNCSGTGLVLNINGEPADCPECEGNSVVEVEADDGQPNEQQEWRDYDQEC